MPAASLPSPSIPNGQQNGGCVAVNIIESIPHFGISTLETDFHALFNDIKFVCTGGSAGRMAKYAKEFSALAGVPTSENLSKTDRYAMYKTGPVLWVNHGMGVPSLSIMLIEVFKLLKNANATGVEIIRIGTCGGVGVQPGTVILSTGAINGAMEQKHVQWINGKQIKRDAILNERLGNDLFDGAKVMGVPVERGLTFCADDFYEGQMRLDGYFCDYDRAEKMAFLKRLGEMGVKNIEMESTVFAAFTHRAHIPAAICCVVLVNRMVSDCIQMEPGAHAELERRPFRVVCEHMLKRMRRAVDLQNGGSMGENNQNNHQQ